MAIWTWPGNGWVKVPWQRDRHDGRCVIYGAGPSLVDAPSPKDRLRICVNFAFRRIEPHIWVGLEEPKIYGELVSLPFPKVFRGNYGTEPVDGRMAREYPMAFFADISQKENAVEGIFEMAKLDTVFVWNRNTTTFAVQLALWLGYRDLAFAGVDLTQGKGYFDPKLLERYTPLQIERLDRLLEQEFLFFRWLAKEAKSRQITLTNLSAGSRLEEIMPTETLEA